MKKKHLLIGLIILVVICLAGMLWWNKPITFLGNVLWKDIVRIEAFDGATGKSFTITDTKDIEYVVANIQGKSMKKEKSSLGYMGTRFRLQFVDGNGKKIDEFIINSCGTIRKDPFFYCDKSESLCIDYLNMLEKQQKE